MAAMAWGTRRSAMVVMSWRPSRGLSSSTCLAQWPTTMRVTTIATTTSMAFPTEARNLMTMRPPIGPAHRTDRLGACGNQLRQRLASPRLFLLVSDPGHLFENGPCGRDVAAGGVRIRQPQAELEEWQVFVCHPFV